MGLPALVRPAGATQECLPRLRHLLPCALDAAGLGFVPEEDFRESLARTAAVCVKWRIYASHRAADRSTLHRWTTLTQRDFFNTHRCFHSEPGPDRNGDFTTPISRKTFNAANRFRAVRLRRTLRETLRAYEDLLRLQ